MSIDTVDASLKGPIARMPGQACNNYRGVCDDLGRCRKTGKRGAGDRLRRFLAADVVKHGLSRYGLYIALCIIALIILAIVLKTVMKKKQTSRSSAYNMAKVTLLWREANKHYTELSQRLDVLQAQFKAHVEDNTIFSYRMATESEISRSLARLKALFPDAQNQVIQTMVEQAHTEESVVEQLLEKGHHMKKIM